jgi:hypothetical protein
MKKSERGKQSTREILSKGEREVVGDSGRDGGAGRQGRTDPVPNELNISQLTQTLMQHNIADVHHVQYAGAAGVDSDSMPCLFAVQMPAQGGKMTRSVTPSSTCEAIGAVEWA